MAISAEPRVALYFDFDNIVISRYDQLHGDGQYRKDTSRTKAVTAGTQTAARLREATVDVDAVLDFAATFGTIAIARAYADWSTPVNASYRGQLIDRAVDLVQLFPLSATKNGADIRLAVDAVEDMFRIDDLSHIVIVAGDSDYVALAQKCKRLGRYVIGIGVAGGTSRALTASCDEYADYDALLSTDAAVEADEAASEPVEASCARGAEEPPCIPRRRKGEDDGCRGRCRRPPTAAEAASEASAEAAPGEGVDAGRRTRDVLRRHGCRVRHRNPQPEPPAPQGARAAAREERRGVAAERRGEEPDAAHGPVVPGASSRVRLVHRVREIAWRCRRARRVRALNRIRIRPEQGLTPQPERLPARVWSDHICYCGLTTRTARRRRQAVDAHPTAESHPTPRAPGAPCSITSRPSC